MMAGTSSMVGAGCGGMQSRSTGMLPRCSSAVVAAAAGHLVLLAAALILAACHAAVAAMPALTE